MAAAAAATAAANVAAANQKTLGQEITILLENDDAIEQNIEKQNLMNSLDPNLINDPNSEKINTSELTDYDFENKTYNMYEFYFNIMVLNIIL